MSFEIRRIHINIFEDRIAKCEVSKITLPAKIHPADLFSKGKKNIKCLMKLNYYFIHGVNYF